MKMTKQDMPETMYRASRCCRVLGNPTAYRILRFLDTKRKTLTQVSQALRLSLPAVSFTMREFRNVDLVRCATKGITPADQARP